jgi:hypothetical protein
VRSRIVWRDEHQWRGLLEGEEVELDRERSFRRSLDLRNVAAQVRCNACRDIRNAPNSRITTSATPATYSTGPTPSRRANSDASDTAATSSRPARTRRGIDTRTGG